MSTEATMFSTNSYRACAVTLCYISTSLLTPAGLAQKKYDPGATDSEIKIGQTMPYSGPVTAAAMNGKAQGAYFNMINERGGVNGRKIKFLSLDDGYNPARTVEQTRKLVEQEEVLLIFGSLGTATTARSTSTSTPNKFRTC
jgi:branched-chain amino acid transport system substrate-binding protein